MELSKYVACICEGASEETIIKILLDANKLKFTYDDLIDNDIIRCRSAQKFEERYLRKRFSGEITILRVLDSRRENFKLSKAYEKKIKVINIITAPEIEMLVILNEKQYENFKRSGKKPSDYCKSDLHYHDVKSKSFLTDYFSDVNVLISAIREYRKKAQNRPGEFALTDILK